MEATVTRKTFRTRAAFILVAALLSFQFSLYLPRKYLSDLLFSSDSLRQVRTTKALPLFEEGYYYYVEQLEEILRRRQDQPKDETKHHDRSREEDPSLSSRNASTESDRDQHLFVNCKRSSSITKAPVFIEECDDLKAALQDRLSIVPILASQTTRPHHSYTIGVSVWHKENDSALRARFADRPSGLTRWITASVLKYENATIHQPQIRIPPPNNTLFNMGTPSVAVFHHGAYADLRSGRIQTTTIATSCNSTHDKKNNTTCNENDQEVVVQFNNCGAVNSTPFVSLSHQQANQTLSASSIYHLETAVVFGDAYSIGFFHATVEQLSRVLAIRDFLSSQAFSKKNSTLTIVLRNPSSLLETYIEDLLGSDIAHRVVIAPSDVVYADTLLVVEPTPCGNLQPFKARQARDLIREHVLQRMTTFNDEDNKLHPPEIPRYILVVRRRAKRDVENHDELFQSLQSTLPEEHFVLFDEEQLPSPGLDQWDIFANAKVVVAPHGAGLSNLLAAPNDAIVVEFLGEGRDLNMCFWSLALALGLEYHPLTMDRIDPFLRNETHHSHYTVDVPLATRVVADIVRRQWNDSAHATDRRNTR